MDGGRQEDKIRERKPDTEEARSHCKEELNTCSAEWDSKCISTGSDSGALLCSASSAVINSEALVAERGMGYTYS